MTHRQLWRELNTRCFYTRTDLVLDLFLALLIVAMCVALFFYEFNLWSNT